MRQYAGDKLIFELAGRQFALDTSTVERIVELDRIYFLPGMAGFVEGVITLRGEPVAVVDAGKAITGQAPRPPARAHKVIVAREDHRVIGLDIGEAEVSFLWDHEIEGCAVEAAPEGFIRAVLKVRDSRTELIDTAAVYEESKKLLSTGETIE